MFNIQCLTTFGLIFVRITDYYHICWLNLSVEDWLGIIIVNKKPSLILFSMCFCLPFVGKASDINIISPYEDVRENKLGFMADPQDEKTNKIINNVLTVGLVTFSEILKFARSLRYLF